MKCEIIADHESSGHFVCLSFNDTDLLGVLKVAVNCCYEVKMEHGYVDADSTIQATPSLWLLSLHSIFLTAVSRKKFDNSPLGVRWRSACG